MNLQTLTMNHKRFVQDKVILLIFQLTTKKIKIKAFCRKKHLFSKILI